MIINKILMNDATELDCELKKSQNWLSYTIVQK